MATDHVACCQVPCPDKDVVAAPLQSSRTRTALGHGAFWRKCAVGSWHLPAGRYQQRSAMPFPCRRACRIDRAGGGGPVKNQDSAKGQVVKTKETINATGPGRQVGVTSNLLSDTHLQSHHLLRDATHLPQLRLHLLLHLLSLVLLWLLSHSMRTSPHLDLEPPLPIFNSFFFFFLRDWHAGQERPRHIAILLY